MKPILTSIGIVLGVLFSSDHASGSSGPFEAIAEAPSCTVDCLVSAAVNYTRAIDDTTCLCHSAGIQQIATPRILRSCGRMDALETENLTEKACNVPIRDRADQYSVLLIVLAIITNIIVAMRLMFKQFFSHRRSLGLDDWAIIGATIIGICSVVISARGLVRNGLGKDVWTLDLTTRERFGIYFYTLEIAYLAEMSLIRLSLSLFYLTIFPDTLIRRVILGTAIFHTISLPVYTISSIWQCTPIEYLWMQYIDDGATGKCINVDALACIQAAIGIATDLWMIAIPFSQLRKLQLHWKKKAGVAIMFLSGALVTIVSALRLESLVSLAGSSNPTWDDWMIALWSMLEVHVGIICASLPTIRLIFVRLWPRIFSTNTNSHMSRLDGEVGRRNSGPSTYCGHGNVSSIELIGKVEEQAESITTVETAIEQPRPGLP